MTQRPNADIDNHGVKVGGNGSYWDCVNDLVSDGDTTRIRVLQGDINVFGVGYSGGGAVVLSANEYIEKVRIGYTIKGTPTGDSYSQSGFRINGVDYYGPLHTHSKTAYTAFLDDHTVNPATGVEWQANDKDIAFPFHLQGAHYNDIGYPRLTMLFQQVYIGRRPEAPATGSAPSTLKSSLATPDEVTAAAASLSYRATVLSLAPRAAGSAVPKKGTGS